MKIDFVRSGGFAGLRLARTFDTGELPPAQGQKLEELVESADFFGLPDPAPAPSQARDVFEYRLTISVREQTRAMVLSDGSMPDKLQPLIAYLVSLVKGAAAP